MPAEYPAGVYAPRTKENYTGVIYDPDLADVGYVEDVTNLDAEVVAIETELGANPKGDYADVAARLEALEFIDSAPADTVFNGPKTTLVANGDIEVGDVCFIDSGEKAVLAKADDPATANATHMATADVADGDPGVFLCIGFGRNDAWTALTAGALVFLSAATAGKITSTAPSAAGDVVQILGQAKTTKMIYFTPQLVQVEHV